MKIFLKVIGGIIGLIALAAIGIYSFGTADLRTNEVKVNPQENLAKDLLNKMGEAHAIKQWDSISTYSLVIKDDFFGFLGKRTNPFPEQEITLELRCIPKTFDGQLKVLSGVNKGMIWGIQSWNTYTIENDEPIFKANSDIVHKIPTLQYYLEFPMRIQNADAFGYVGEQVINNIDCHGIIASWGTIEPQRDIDQYLIWLSKENHRIVKLEYTVRDKFNFVTSYCLFEDYQSFDGILLPTRIPVKSNLFKKDELVHVMELSAFKKDIVEISQLRPNAD